jgi:hypothetical protein
MDDIKEIDAWLKANKMVESRLGMLACANQKAVERIRCGAARITTLYAVMDYIREHPPGRKAKK